MPRCVYCDEKSSKGSDCEGCDSWFCEGCASVEICKDCGYSACDNCIVHHSRGTCMCPYSNFGTPYCDYDGPEWYHGAEGKQYDGPYKPEGQVEDEHNYGNTRCLSCHSCGKEGLGVKSWAELAINGKGDIALLPAAHREHFEKHKAEIEALKEKSLLRCSGCHTTWYCSKECQRKDWKPTKGDRNRVPEYHVWHKSVCRPFVMPQDQPYLVAHRAECAELVKYYEFLGYFVP